MTPLSSIFAQQIDFAPGTDIDAFLKDVPARWAVYLFCDQRDQPIQLLCVKNLRYSLKRRLGGQQQIGPTKRVSYPDLVRRVYWRRVDSAFEADCVYLQAARRVFPDSYRGMVGFRPARFVHVDPDAPFPRYMKTTELDGEGVLIGPVEDKHAAQRLIELLEDCFDLCRYHNVLAEAPHGKPCAYKEMGKCPAPCDGSIGIDEYRRMIRKSLEAVVAPAEFIAEQKQKMEQAAAGLQFELAKRFKGKMEAAEALGKGAYRQARRLEDFEFISLQNGPRKGTAKLFLVVGGVIEEALGLIGDPTGALESILARAGEFHGHKMDEEEAERLAVVASHLFSGKPGRGTLIRLCECDEETLAKRYREMLKQKEAVEVEEEGIVKELEGM